MAVVVMIDYDGMWIVLDGVVSKVLCLYDVEK